MTPRSPLGWVVTLFSLGIVCHDQCNASAEDEVIRCRHGWGSAEKTIPAEWINDEYCDCPYDGLDEPGTEACSGSSIGGWSGISTLEEWR